MIRNSHFTLSVVSAGGCVYKLKTFKMNSGRNFFLFFLPLKENLHLWKLHSRLGWICLDRFLSPTRPWKALRSGGQAAPPPSPAPTVTWTLTAVIVSRSYVCHPLGAVETVVRWTTRALQIIIRLFGSVIYKNICLLFLPLPIFSPFFCSESLAGKTFFQQHSLLMNVLWNIEISVLMRPGFFFNNRYSKVCHLKW